MTLFSKRALALALPLALTLTACDSNDDDGTPGTEEAVFATSNVSDGASDAVVRLAGSLTSEASFSGLVGATSGATSIQSVALRDGDGYVSVDLGEGAGGIVYLRDLCQGSNCDNASGTIGAGARLIAGSATGLVAPKGIVNEDDKIFVADNGSNSIRVFAEDATGNVAPLFVVSNLGEGTNVWDMAYNDGDDRLFVATTNGLVLVYDRVSTADGRMAPARTITPTDGTTQISVNLHGIAYDSSLDLLVLTDVGQASGDGSASDGQLFTIANAKTASGNTAVRYRISGDASRLGNPVDVAFGRSGEAFVAEKSNNAVLRFDGVTTATGASTAAAAASATVQRAESVSVVSR